MRFMLFQFYSGPQDLKPIWEWEPEDVQAHIQWQQDLNVELTATGELIDAQGLAGPDEAKLVTSDGVTAPVVTDGPFPESKEFLAGYRTVEVDTLERAIELAGICSASPGPGGVPIGQAIELRQIMGAPSVEV
jgi:hypothetical protein